MRFLFLSLLIAVSAHALPTAPKSIQKPFDLMKCTGAKHGTIWASFGHLLRSGEEKLQYFPTEIVYFGPDLSWRQVYFDINEALKVEVVVGTANIRMRFSAKSGEREQTHLLQLMLIDPRATNSFMGNWTRTEGPSETMDSIACTAN